DVVSGWTWRWQKNGCRGLHKCLPAAPPAREDRNGEEDAQGWPISEADSLRVGDRSRHGERMDKAMSLKKRGKNWFYEFVVDGVRYRGSTKVGNKEKARNYETSVRMKVLDGRFGITKREPAPTFKDFYPDLVQELKNRSETTHPRTIENAEQLL